MYETPRSPSFVVAESICQPPEHDSEWKLVLLGGYNPGSVRKAIIAILALCFACTASEGEPGPCLDHATIDSALRLRCFPQRVEVQLDPASPEFGRAPCQVYEVFSEGAEACSCTSPGYELPGDVPESVVDELSRTGQCAGDPCCSSKCFCELEQLRGGELEACQNGTENQLESMPIGWCYVDPEQGVGTAEVVASCPLSNKRLLRHLVPHSTVHFVVICSGAVL